MVCTPAQNISLREGITVASRVRVQLGTSHIIEQDTKMYCLNGGLMAGCNNRWMDGWMTKNRRHKMCTPPRLREGNRIL